MQGGFRLDRSLPSGYEVVKAHRSSLSFASLCLRSFAVIDFLRVDICDTLFYMVGVAFSSFMTYTTVLYVCVSFYTSLGVQSIILKTL